MYSSYFHISNILVKRHYPTQIMFKLSFSSLCLRCIIFFKHNPFKQKEDSNFLCLIRLQLHCTISRLLRGSLSFCLMLKHILFIYISLPQEKILGKEIIYFKLSVSAYDKKQRHKIVIHHKLLYIKLYNTIQAMVRLRLLSIKIIISQNFSCALIKTC